MKFMRKRSYVKSARAESEAETRERIVDAVVALHREVGPARTSISAVAERAGVQRLTVYRHFPDEESLFAACSSKWNATHPFPDLDAITAADPRKRARAMLIALYRWFRAGEEMLASVYADYDRMPQQRAAFAPMHTYLERLASEVEKMWRGRSAKRAATLRHAVQFATWRSLKALTKDDTEIADLVLHWL